MGKITPSPTSPSHPSRYSVFCFLHCLRFYTLLRWFVDRLSPPHQNEVEVRSGILSTIIWSMQRSEPCTKHTLKYLSSHESESSKLGCSLSKYDLEKGAERERVGSSLDIFFIQVSLTTRKNNDSWTCTPIPKHLSQALLLIRPKNSCGFQANVDIRVNRIIPEVVFCQQRVLQVDASFLEFLNHLLGSEHKGFTTLLTAKHAH